MAPTAQWSGWAINSNPSAAARSRSACHTSRSSGEGVIARAKAAGLTIFGKTASPEFGLTTSTESKLWGATRNPWNLKRIAGGSSGGAAAAVAARILPMAHT